MFSKTALKDFFLTSSVSRGSICKSLLAGDKTLKHLTLEFISVEKVFHVLKGKACH